MRSRTCFTLAALGFSLAACSMIGARPSASIDPSPAAPSPSASATALASAPATASPAPTYPPSPNATETAMLDGREFVSVLVTENGKSKALVSGTKIRLGFSNGQVSASSGCNTMSGDYQLTNGKLVVGQMATTDIGCPTDLGAQDQWLAELLGAKPLLTLNGNNLSLATDTTQVDFLDREKAEPDQPLVGITWGLTTIVDGDTASSVPAGVMATLLFKDDGTVQVDYGCNAGGGNYTVDGDTIHLSQLMRTAMACGGDKDAVEASVSAVLNADNVTFSIDHATLSLNADGHGLQYDAAVDTITDY